jgi:iron complex outermembrane receptor protein
MVLLALPLLSITNPANAGHTRYYDIKVGEARSTLRIFAKQSQTSPIFDFEAVAGRMTRAVKGQYEPEQVLRLMLAGTGLEFKFTNSSDVAIRPSVQDPIARSSDNSVPAADRRAPALEEVRVTSTGTNIPGQRPIGPEVISIGTDDIERSRSPTVGELLKKMPQVFGGGPSLDTHNVGHETQTNSAIGTGVNLRGLDAGSTLVLLDGRRFAPGGDEGAFVDVSTIPITAIDRIEIIPDGASAIYGADAVGGVVNLFPYRNFDGATSQLWIGSAANAADERLLSHRYGVTWSAGYWMFSAEEYKKNALRAKDQRQATNNLTGFGGDNFDSIASYTGTIVDVIGQTWAVPSTQGGPLIAGTKNTFDRFSGTDITPTQERFSLFSAGEQNVAQGLVIFGTALVTRRTAEQINAGQEAALDVPNTNPFYVKPAGYVSPVADPRDFVRVLRSLGNELGLSKARVTENVSNITLGGRVQAGEWQVSLAAQYAEEHENLGIENQINFAALANALADTNPLTAFNPFGGGARNDSTTIAGIRTDRGFTLESQLQTLSVNGNGPLGSLPGGTPQLAAGAEYRKQMLSTRFSGVSAANSPSDLQRHTTAAFSEITLPLIGAGNQRRFARSLEVSLAGRYEKYSDAGGTFVPKMGFEWLPEETVTIRGSVSLATHAPTLADLNERSNTSAVYTLMDPAIPNHPQSLLIWSGQNAALRNERALSWTAGLDCKPVFIPNLKLSGTYFNVTFRNRILPITLAPDILSNPRYQNAVTRNPSAAEREDVCSHTTFVNGNASDCRNAPVVALVDTRLHNVSTLRTSGLDLTLSYGLNGALGLFGLELNGTRLLDYSVDAPGSPAERVLNTPHNPIDLRIRGSVSWRRGNLGIEGSANFTDGYRDTLSQPARDVGSWTTVGMAISYDWDVEASVRDAGVRVTLSSDNLFNVHPPFLNNRVAAIGYDQENADLGGRTLLLQLVWQW